MCDIYYNKSKKIDLGKIGKDYTDVNLESTKDSISYNPFHIRDLQNYNPIYSLFFEMNDTNYNAISLNHPNHFLDMNTVVRCEGEGEVETKLPKNIHIKYAPLLDPIHYLIGKYEKERTRITLLPSLIPSIGIPKIESVYNSAYIDCFFSYLSSNLFHKNGFLNSIDFYGSYLGVQEKFRMDISDDYDYLLESDFFLYKKNILYEIDSNCFLPSSDYVRTEKGDSFSLKPKLSLGEIYSENIAIDVDVDIETPEISLETPIEIESALELVYETETKKDPLDEEEDSDDSEDNSIENHSIDLDGSKEKEGEEDETEEEWSDMEDDEDSQEEEEPLIHAYIHDFPIQMICLEKGEGTLDALLEKDELEDAQIASALFQVVMSLAAFQKAYDFTHNDLHTNNIVYFTTEYTHLEYTLLEKTYKVPTYGRIYKIIDFGRSMYRFQDKVLGSDSFAPGGDANGQYNCEPFFNPKKPEIKTNPSFDLCRLGCSMYDFVFDGLEEDEIRNSRKKWTEVQKTIARWCMDDNCKNILYKSSGEERYPNFKLYKMIARMVHAHTPQNQMSFGLFSQYDVSNINDKKKKRVIKPMDRIYKMNIDTIPKCYV
jgi:hypothetical protein